MLVNSICFPDEGICNRHLADVRVLSGATPCSHAMTHSEKYIGNF